LEVEHGRKSPTEISNSSAQLEVSEALRKVEVHTSVNVIVGLTPVFGFGIVVCNHVDDVSWDKATKAVRI